MTTLDRRLGPLDAAAIVVSNVIGGGIFFTPILVAQLVPDPRAILLIWMIGGAFAFMGAMSCRFPARRSKCRARRLSRSSSSRG